MLRFRHNELLLSVAVLLSACAPAATSTSTRPPQQQRPSTAPQQAVTLTPNQITSLAELLRMEDRRVLDTAIMRRHLGDPSAIVRSRAALAGGRIGNVGAAALLRAAVTDGDDMVAADAAFALGELGDTTASTISALAMVMRRASGGAPAREAAHALGKFTRSQSAYAALAAGLEPQSRVAPDVVPEVLLAIWHHPRQPRTVDLAIPYAGSPDPQTRFAATYALMRSGRPGAVGTLISEIHDRDALVRETAARGLRRVAADSAGMLESSRLALTAALRDPEAHVRLNAATALGAYRDSTNAPALAALLSDADGNVRVAAVAALGVIGGQAARSVLARVVDDASMPSAARADALARLVAADPATGLPLAANWTASVSWRTRIYGVRALAAAPYATTGADLRRMVRDPDPRVQAEALGAISAADTADTTHGLDALYVESLGSADPIVRSTAISALARHRDAVYVSALMDAYDRTRTDRENDAALAAVSALGTLARTDSAIARSFFFRFKRSPDPMVRAAVAQSFGSAAAAAWGDVTPTADRPLSWYEQIIRTYVAPVLAGGPRPRVRIRTSQAVGALSHTIDDGIVIELASEDAPLTVDNFLSLIRNGYFTSTDRNPMAWHRVVPNFVLQDGDPRGDGNGGPGYSIRDEMNRLRYTRGAVGMALSGPDTGGSQFFITHSPQPHLDGGYTVFGYVTSGMAVADRVLQDDPIHAIEIIR